jgi:alpha-tubulin suppressor-like RCC1 family protein
MRNLLKVCLSVSKHCLSPVADQNRVFSYREFAAFTAAEQHERTWHIATTKNIVQLVANESSFSLLTAEGVIYSWGDPRYSLGREVLAGSPATDPTIVTALEGLRISKISAGGWLTAALSNDRDLYIWGRSSSGGDIASDIEFLPDEPGGVGLVDLGEGVDISDVAVGSGHVCLLTDGGDVYAAGRNSNGQVGAGEGEFQSKWNKWEATWKGTAKAVYSGPFSWNTFVVVETGIAST